MEDLFASGHAVEIVLIVLALETGWLIGRGRRAVDVVLMLAPAALILLALRTALTGGEWPAIALLLAASFPVHLADLKRRGLPRR